MNEIEGLDSRACGMTRVLFGLGGDDERAKQRSVEAASRKDLLEKQHDSTTI